MEKRIFVLSVVEFRQRYEGWKKGLTQLLKQGVLALIGLKLKLPILVRPSQFCSLKLYEIINIHRPIIYMYQLYRYILYIHK